jgi:hypothetical protein
MKNTRTLCLLFGLACVVVPSVLADTSITAVPFTIKNAGVYILAKNLTYTGSCYHSGQFYLHLLGCSASGEWHRFELFSRRQ